MKYVYILENLDSSTSTSASRTTYEPDWQNITQVRCLIRRNMDLGELGPISRLTTRHALSRSNDI